MIDCSMCAIALLIDAKRRKWLQKKKRKHRTVGVVTGMDGEPFPLSLSLFFKENELN